MVEFVDDVWSFERIAQMRRMSDVLPAVLLHYKSLGPNDLIPAQFQFSCRRTDLLGPTLVVQTTESDADENDEITWDFLEKVALADDKRSDRVADPELKDLQSSDLADPVQELSKEKSGTAVVLGDLADDSDDVQKSGENVSSSVNPSDDSPHSLIHGRNMRAVAPRSRLCSRTPLMRSHSSLFDDRFKLLNRLVVQRLEKQEEIRAHPRGSSSDHRISSPQCSHISDARYYNKRSRSGRSHRSVDEPMASSISRHHHHPNSVTFQSDNECLKDKKKSDQIKVLASSKGAKY